MISDPEHLAAAWREWVATNVGRDSDRADAAAHAAVQVALQGAGFEAAAAAARESWLATAPSHSNPNTERHKMSRGLGFAMAIAVAGCLASAALASGLGIAVNGLGGVAAIFLLYNLGLAALNGILVLFLRRGSRRAWTVTLVLLIVGIIFDVLEQAAMWSSAPFTSVVALPGLLIAFGVGTPLVALGINGSLVWGIVSNWLALHLLAIQVPILLGLVGGRPRAGAPPTAAPSGSAGRSGAAS